MKVKIKEKSDQAAAIGRGEILSLDAAAMADPRSVARELREPGSVRGLAGERIRRAFAQRPSGKAAP